MRDPNLYAFDLGLLDPRLLSLSQASMHTKSLDSNEKNRFFK